MGKLPLWARAYLRTERAVSIASQATAIIREELLFAAASPELRDTFTDLAYQNKSNYSAGGRIFERGLFDWEKSLLSTFGLIDPGAAARSILLGGAGGGRELAVLGRLGHRVTAFEPNQLLFEAAASLIDDLPGCEVLRGSYADLVRAAAGQEGPLASVRGPFDFVILGWGSFTHVTEPEDQRALLTALRAVAPTAPIAMSFFLRPNWHGRADRLRAAVRSVVGRFGSGPATPTGLRYLENSGFAYLFSKEDLEQLARATGYRVSLFERMSFPHALFEPTPPGAPDSVDDQPSNQVAPATGG